MPNYHPTNKTRLFPVCQFNELEVYPSKEVTLFKNGRPYFAFVVKKDDQVFAYANSCPHQGRMLQWKPDTFLNTEFTEILCSAHGATFDIKSGLCVSGPCLGRNLTAVECQVFNGVVMLRIG